MATLLPVAWAGCLLQQPPPPRRFEAEGRGAPAACQLRPGVSCAGGAVSGFTCRRGQRLHACTAQPLLRRACGRGRWALRSSTDSVTPSDGGTRADEATVSPAATSDKAALTTRVASARTCPLPLVRGLSQGALHCIQAKRAICTSNTQLLPAHCRPASRTTLHSTGTDARTRQPALPHHHMRQSW
jgi:hypothetical protein